VQMCDFLLIFVSFERRAARGCLLPARTNGLAVEHRRTRRMMSGPHAWMVHNRQHVGDESLMGAFVILWQAAVDAHRVVYALRCHRPHPFQVRAQWGAVLLVT
jgi:hypothetical protein